ncbi:uncharacterized protein Dana_GF17671 [Drosophila ananassae]|uniref:Uncharacterized protein n=1 Tax=Drosophila ananassae TaxID=7217 RepID=B3LYG3_DROAN|nr:uncharacterized protein Dana_GF17671 [Drosophila ananassae]
MSSRKLVTVLLLVALLGLSLMPSSQARPKRGRKRAFGVGLLGGALAGAVIGNVVAKAQATPAPAPAHAPVAQVHHYYQAPAPPVIPAPVAVPLPVQPDPKKMTVIETGTPDANGCYKQTIREPNPSNQKTYTETEHLICPTLQTNVAPPAIPPSPVHVPVMPQPFPVIHVPAAAPPAPATAAAAPAAPVAQSPVAHAPVAQTPVAPAPISPVHLSYPPGTHQAAAVPVPAPIPAASPVLIPAPPPGHAPVPAPAPVPLPAPVPASNPAIAQNPHVIVLSKKTVYYPKKRSLAPSLSIPQSMLVLIVLFYGTKMVLF